MIIKTSDGYPVQIDEQDFDLVSQYRWKTERRGRANPKLDRYAIAVRLEQGKRKKIAMHRLILGVVGSPTPLVDHIDGDGLNNTRANLRTCTNAENIRNRGKFMKGTTSIFKGVRRRDNGTYTAQIRVNWKVTHLGTFKTEQDAADAYDKAAMQMHGAFAWLNRDHISA